ncbi:MAG: 3-isopropylmalate dehydratase [Planctomycetota bacterium]
MPDAVITGKAFVLGHDIDTDQIIPAEYLAYDPSVPEERKFFGMYACVGVPEAQSGLPAGGMKLVDEGAFKSDYAVVIGGKNFGCGSSREHAPLALAEAGVQAVVAQFYARIFFRNCVNGGYLLPAECETPLTDGKVKTGDQVTLDPVANTLTNHDTGETFQLSPLGEVKPIVDAGGVFNYARQTGMLSS